MAENSTGKERSLLGIVPKGVSGLQLDGWPRKSQSGAFFNCLEVHSSSCPTDIPGAGLNTSRGAQFQHCSRDALGELHPLPDLHGFGAG